MKANIHIRQYLTEFFLEREMFQTKSVEKNQNQNLKLSNFFLENPVFYEIMLKNTVWSDRPQLTI